MHAALLTAILSTGIGYGQVPGGYDHYQSSAQHYGESDGSGEGYGGVYPWDASFGHGALHVKFGPMPQSCYEPRYGCYPGNARFTHRYPAFHGWFYRRPYNYRQYFDYTWHAGLHEPTSLFSYDVSEESAQRAPVQPQRGGPLVAPQRSSNGLQYHAPAPGGNVVPQGTIEEPVFPPSASRRTRVRPAGHLSPHGATKNRWGGAAPNVQSRQQPRPPARRIGLLRQR